MYRNRTSGTESLMWYFEMLPHLDLTLISRCVAFCGTSCITMFNSPPQMQILRERIPDKMYVWVKDIVFLIDKKHEIEQWLGFNFLFWVILKEAINKFEFICILIILILWKLLLEENIRNMVWSDLFLTIILSYLETASWNFYIPGNGIFSIVNNQHV